MSKITNNPLALMFHMEIEISPKLEQSVRSGMMGAFIAYWKQQIDFDLLQDRLAEAGYTQGIEANELYKVINPEDIH